MVEGIVSSIQNCPALLVGGHLDLTSAPVPLSPQDIPTPLFGVSSFRQQQKPKGLSQLLGAEPCRDIGCCWSPLCMFAWGISLRACVFFSTHVTYLCFTICDPAEGVAQHYLCLGSLANEPLQILNFRVWGHTPCTSLSQEPCTCSPRAPAGNETQQGAPDPAGWALKALLGILNTTRHSLPLKRGKDFGCRKKHDLLGFG